MLQTVMQVSAASRITSYSSSFHPIRERSTRTWWMGDAARPPRVTARSWSMSLATPPPVPPSV